MVKADWTSGNLGIKDAAGNDIKANYKSFMSAYESAKTKNATTVTFRNTATGRDETISMYDAENQKGYLMKMNEDDYIRQNIAGTAAKKDERFITLMHAADVLGGTANFERGADGNIDFKDSGHGKERSIKISDSSNGVGRDSIWNAIEGFEDYNGQLNRQNAINKSDDRFSGGKK